MSENNLILGNPAEESTKGVGELTEQNVNELVNNLPSDKKEKILSIATSVNIEDSQALLQYGVGIQSKIADFSDSVLSEVRSKDSGFVGEIMSQLSTSVKAVDAGGFIENVTGNKKFSLFDSLKGRIKKFIAKYEKLDVQIDKICTNLENSRIGLLKDIEMFDILYQKNLETIAELDFYIVAGIYKLKELKENILPALKAKADQSGDALELQKYQDLSATTERFDKKVHDLRLSRIIAIQSAPQIRLVQNNDKLIVDKIQSSILNTIPLWKSQIVIAIGLFRQKNALEMQKNISATTNELLAKNSEMLKQSTIETAAEAEKGIVEIETLKLANDNLIATIEETIKIQSEGREKRRAVETELASIEKQLKDKLSSLN